MRAPLRETKMNRTEEKYAELLWIRQRAGEVRRYWFEPFKLRLGPTTFYTPDFALWMVDDTVEVHEVKGFWRDDARVKFKTAAQAFPIFRFVAVQLVKGVWTFEQIAPHG